MVSGQSGLACETYGPHPSLSVRADTQRLLQRLVIFALWLARDSYALTSEGDYCTEPPHQLIARAGVTAMLKLTVQACKEFRDAGPSGLESCLRRFCVSEPHKPSCANRVPKSTATRVRQF
jgi:hypothetical protein